MAVETPCGCVVTPVDPCLNVTLCKTLYPAGCVSYGKSDLICLNLPIGTRLDVILKAIDTKLCESISGFIPASAWATYDYSCLSSDFVHTQEGFVEGISDIICNIQQDIEVLQILTDCPTWIDLPFETGWDNAVDALPIGNVNTDAGYTNTGTACGVSLRGYVQGTYTGINNLVCTLPVGYRPPTARVFPTSIRLEATISGSYDGNCVSGFLLVLADGSVYLDWNGRIGTVTVTDVATQLYVSLETVHFETA